MTSRSTAAFDALLFFGIVILFGLAGCGDSDDNNDGHDITSSTDTSTDPTLSVSTCSNNTKPCSHVTDKNGIIRCRLLNSVCGVDLDDVVSQVGNGVTEDTTMWIQAWGGAGGKSVNGCGGGNSGYAQTTTSVSDIKSYTGSAQLYYYTGNGGGNGDDHCGGAGGSATIVTLENLLLTPKQGPSLAAPPTLLVAGGGGGGSARNVSDLVCASRCGGDGGRGGIALASTDMNGSGAGTGVFSNMGGHLGIGGIAFCTVCNSGNETAGLDAFGGHGGAGGSGQNCSGPKTPNWSNTGSSSLKMIAGAGGKGSSNTKLCDAGGGGGGGGWGGGGGGGHGNDSGSAVPGGGGGSFAIVSTRSSSAAPTSRPGNPCSNTSNGCVRIEFKP